MKVCVLGGAGYIGSHATKELIKDGAEVVVIDNLSTGYRDLVNPKAKFYYGDITNPSDLINIFNIESNKKPFDVIMHFAAKILPDESMINPLDYYYNNVEGVRIVLDVMLKFNIKNIVFSSTAAVYGMTTNPTSDESEVPSPMSPYGESKLVSENMIRWAAEAYDIKYCIFRYFNVAGADEDLEVGLRKDQLTTLIPIAVQTLLKQREKMYVYGNDYPTDDGTCERDYIHPTDLALAHILGAKYLLEKKESLLLNLGSNKAYSVLEIIEEVSKYGCVNYEIGKRRLGDPVKVIASNKKAKELLGWKPKYDLESIIKTDINYRKKINNIK